MLHHGEGRVCKRVGSFLLISLLSALLSLVGWYARPLPAAANDAGRLVALINSARVSAGLPRVVADARLTSIAQAHAQRMASAGRVFHNSSFASQAAPWEAWGENVGSGSDVDSVHRAFLSSATHKRTMLNAAFNMVGVGIARAGGKLMVVEDFIKRSGPVATSPRFARAAARNPPPPPPEVAEFLEPMACHWNGSPEDNLEPRNPLSEG